MRDKIIIFLKGVNWIEILHRLLLVVFAFYLSLAFVGYNILLDDKVLNDFLTTKYFFMVSGILSLTGFSAYLVHYLTKKNALKLILGYVIYLLVSYFLLITRNINNNKFKIWNLGKNQFFEYRGLLVVLLAITLAFAIKYFVEKFYLEDKFDAFFQDYRYSGSPLYYLVTILVLSDSKLLTIFSQIVSLSLDDNNISQFISTLSINLLLTFIAFYFIVRFAYQAIDAVRVNKPNFSLAFTTSLFLAVVFNYTLQLGVKTNGSLMDMFIFPGATTYQIAFILIFNLLLYLIVNRYVTTTFFEIIFWGVISVVNFIKQEMRNEPLLISDFSWLKDFDLLLEYVDAKLVLFLSVIIISLAVIIVWLGRKNLSGKVILKKRFRSIYFTVLAAVVILSSTVLLNENNGVVVDGIPVISQLNNNYNVYWLGPSVHATYRSLMYVWTKQLTSPAMETPKGYSEEKIKEIADKYMELADEINQSRTENIEDQTVIYVLSESLSDPSRILGVKLSENAIPYIDYIKTTTTSGLMKSDGYGGGTANMEFQSLTGLPMYNLSSSITSLTTEIVPKMSYIPSISNAFEAKNRIVIHLGDAETYSRSNMYDKLDFNKFVAVKNGTDKENDVVNLGNFPSDTSTYSSVLSNINSNESQFFSVITYQNHVPWVYSFDKTISAIGSGFSEEENEELANYVNLLRETDTATQDFLNALSNIDKKITVVFYGDHLPGFYPQSAFDSDGELQYQTDYFIWNNYQTVQLNHSYVNSSDFTAELLEQTNSKVSPYYALLTEVLNYASVDKETLSKEGEEIASDLKLIEYDLIQGKGYIKQYTNFFKFEN